MTRRWACLGGLSLWLLAAFACGRFDADSEAAADVDAGGEVTPPIDGGGAVAVDGGAVDGGALEDAVALPDFDGGCPDDMVAATTFCIDKTEVTEGAYAKVGGEIPLPRPPPCQARVNFRGGTKTGILRPVADVDWCDARAYCLAVGKRLCTVAEGTLACKGPKGTTYPYGNTYNPLSCNGGQSGHDGMSIDVASLASCEGGYPGLFDMSGNVDEWTSTCYVDGGTTFCATRGGEHGDQSGSSLTCASRPPRQFGYVGGQVGFRCCR